MKLRTVRLSAVLFFALSVLGLAQRPPAVPLVTHDPYFSIWSMGDRLNADTTRHWTGKPNSLASLVRIDGKAYRLMGFDRGDAAEAMPQKDLTVTPTQTKYRFENDTAAVALTFTSPLLPDDLDVLARPVTYVTWSVQAMDGREHRVQLYFEASSELAVNTPDQPVEWARLATAGLGVVRLGSRAQPMLQKSGDDLRIDWGYLYLAARPGEGLSEAANDRAITREAFRADGAVPAEDAFGEHDPGRRGGNLRNPVLAASFDLGTVGTAAKSRFLMLAYDDLYSLEFFNRRVHPYWRRNGADAAALLRSAGRDYESLVERCDRFDRKLMAELTAAGGKEYAALCAVAYRQAVAAHKLAVDADGSLLFFSKENFSNGSINTVDVFYPSSPLFLAVNPKLLRASVEPVLQYASMSRWPWPYSPHDLGTYPLANGQTYGGGEQNELRQMPVEESGNMLLLTAALAKAEGKADLAQKYWPLLTKWAEYLRDKGLDPENQLCTDDFAGHLARNANLSLKAVEALGAYAMLARLTGRDREAAAWQSLAREYAQKWMKLADVGDHYVLAFGQPSTWSQKYNLVWDRLLGLNLFPPEIARKEIAYYKTKQNVYGLPLDNRAEYTKLDWLVWTATLAESPADFEGMVAPAYKWMNETPTRVPLTDWYMTRDGKQRGFQARSVVGGVFIKLLAERWK